jgi:hypothetical protein
MQELTGTLASVRAAPLLPFPVPTGKVVSRAPVLTGRANGRQVFAIQLTVAQFFEVGMPILKNRWRIRQEEANIKRQVVPPSPPSRPCVPRSA